MTNSTIVRKLSIKAIAGSLKTYVMARLADDYEGDDKLVNGQKLDVAQIFGIANGVKSGEGTYGTWYGFTGSHEGVNVLTGETFTSSNAFLPEVATDLMRAALKDHDELEYAFQITAVIDGDMKEGYSYNVTPLMQVEERLDPLAAIKAKIAANSAPALVHTDAPKAAVEKKSK
jgi:hypothetical protein